MPASPPHAWLGARLWARIEPHALWWWTLVGVLPRIFAVQKSDLDLDETWTWFFTSHVLEQGAFFSTIAVGLDAPLFCLINLWIAKYLGLSILSVRLPALLFGIASVPMSFLLFRRLLDARRASAVAGLVATSPFLIHYSLEARPYAQFLFFGLVFAHAFVASEALSLGKRRWLLVACTVLLVGSHYYALLYLATFYAIVLWGHAAAGRRAELRRDFVTGAWTLLASVPLLLPLLARVFTLDAPYWKFANITLFGVLAEQLWFLGFDLGPGNLVLSLTYVAIVALWALPVLVALRHRRAEFAVAPLIAWLGCGVPAFVVVCGLVVGRDVLFFPRGFIAGAPFLYALWVQGVASVPWNVITRRLYIACVLVPFLLSAFLVASSHPAQAHLKGRQVMREIVERADAYADQYDVLVVHHWWLAMYFYYRSAQPARVLAPGWNPATPAGGDAMAPVLADIAKIPASSRVLLVLNDLATDSVDRDGRAIAALRKTHRLLSEIKCHPAPPAGSTLLCNRMLLFGARVVSLPP